MKHIIIGTGAAGMAAAGTIREIDPEARITMISEDDTVHSRCLLHYYISGERSEKNMSFVSEDFFEKNSIDRIMGKKVTAIDAENKIITYDDGTISYDRLLIATGSESFIPPVGALRTAKNVYGLRHLLDARNIRKCAETAQNVVIIGAGLVGLDAAYSLIRLGKKVSVVEVADRILALNLDHYSSKAYRKKFEEAGCSFFLGKKASDTICADGYITSVLLDSGEKLDCDMVIVAAGVRPAMNFPGGGFECDRSIIVDDHMRTNIKDVFAAGDVTGLSGIWPNAAMQGKVAAENMCGKDSVYTDSFANKNTINFFGLETLSVGKLDPEEGDRIVIMEDRRVYKKAVLTGNTVSGVILQGDISNSGFWQYLIKNKVALKEGRFVFKTSFADYYGIDSDGSYVWTVN